MSTSSEPAGSGESQAGGLILVKLGGSLITDKRRPGHFRAEVVDSLARQLATVLPSLAARGTRLILGHGSGSFGHVAAERHGLGSGPGRSLGSKPVLAAADVQNVAASLHLRVAEALIARGVPAWSWSPSSTLRARGARLVEGDSASLELALERGCIPLVYGDVVLDHELGATIASTEQVLSFLVARLLRAGASPSRLLWLGETDGIYGADGRPIARIDDDNRTRARQAIGAAAGTDVTGGMLLRLQTAERLAELGIESWILDGRRDGALAAALAPRPDRDLVGGTLVAVSKQAGSQPADDPSSTRGVAHPT